MAWNDLIVKVGMDSSGFSSGTMKVKRDADGLKQGMVSLSRTISDQVSKLNRIERESGKSSTAYKKLSAEISRNKKQLQAMNIEMRNTGAVAKTSGGALASFGASLKGIAGVAVAGAGVATIFNVMRESLSLYDIQEKAIAQVKTGLESTGYAARITLQDLKKEASNLQNDTLFGDEVILKDATAQLLTFTNIAGDEFKRTQRAALDLATRLDGDLKSASIQLGKALNDPIANLSALSRSGIQFSKEQKAVIKSLWETGQTAEAQRVILTELEKQYGGSAAAAAAAGTGGLKQLENRMSDLKERFGEVEMVVISKFLPAIDSAISYMEQMDWESIANGAKKFVDGIFAVSDALGDVARGFNGYLRVAEEWGANIRRLFKGEQMVDLVEVWKDATVKSVQNAGKEITTEIGKALSGFGNEIPAMGGMPQYIAPIKKPNKEPKKGGDKKAGVVTLTPMLENLGMDDIEAFQKANEAAFSQLMPKIDPIAMLPTVTKIESIGAGLGFQLVGAVNDQLNKEPIELNITLPDAQPLADQMQAIAGISQNMGDLAMNAFSNVASGAQTAGDAFRSFGVSAASAVMEVVRARIMEAVAGQAAAPPNAALGIFGIPLIGAAIGAIMGLINGAMSQTKGIKLATGGLAFGETLATIGDNPNAQYDPEVVAPLSKLESMINVSGNQRLSGTFKVRGQDLVLALDNAERYMGKVRK